MGVKSCEACGKRSARYVCQECGREVCDVCLEPQAWVCSNCYRRLKPEAPPTPLEALMWSTPFKLFLLGSLLIFIGMIFIIITSILSGAPSTFGGGAIIFVGPIPIILGTGPYSIWAIILALLLTILGVILFMTWRKRAQ
ncbi:MAG: hypothetical protein AOA65_2388 [Candidatus Bathyarchaeota archaeon BA1]|nr:MAG: hypothetical protein AOA65_2388 [Candidatus Bathyarchaeota archaeon BA1]